MPSTNSVRARERRPALFVAFASLAILAACGVDRRLRIDSEPRGAEVSIDGRLLGETPMEYHFTHYGTHQIYISKKGYKPIDREVAVAAPWYGTFPFDIFSEVLFPVWRRDFRDEHFLLNTQNELLSPKDQAARDAENQRLEEGALARTKDLRRWAPGDHIPDVPKPASSPAKP